MALSDGKFFTREELGKYDGSSGVAYVTFEGKVYDISRSFHWKRGIHQVIHQAGCDLTDALKQASHGPDLLEKFPVVGELLDPG
jgi:predicted heme/steroid binding protein